MKPHRKRHSLIRCAASFPQLVQYFKFLFYNNCCFFIFLRADPVHTGAEAECIASAADERSIDPANHFIFFHSNKSQRCNKTFISKTLFQLSFVCFVRFIIRNRSGISAEPMRLSYVLSDTCFIFVLTNWNWKSPKS